MVLDGERFRDNLYVIDKRTIELAGISLWAHEGGGGGGGREGKGVEREKGEKREGWK